MTFDLQSLYFAVVVFCASAFLAVTFVWATNRRIPGLGWWMLGTLTSPPAWALYLLQGKIDNRWLSFVLPTLFIGITTVAYYEGACKFTGKEPNHKLLVPLSLASLASYFLFFIPLDNQTARILITTFFYGVCTTLTGWVLCRENRPGLRIVARILGVGFFAGSILLAYRFYMWSGEHPPESWNTGSDGGSAFLALALAVVTVFWMLCVLLLVNQWHVRELSLHMASEMEIARELAEARVELERQRTLNLRQTMVRELHDGIGGITATLAMLAGYGKTGVPGTAPDTFGAIEEMAHEGNRNIRSLLDYLDTGVFHWPGMLSEIEDYSRKLSAAAGVTLRWEITGQPDSRSLPDGLVGNTLRMVVMEAVHNLVRHSSAKSGSVLFHFGPDRLDVEIRDDGIGFSKERDGGRGIRHMRARMEEAGGGFAIDNDQGTRINLTLPMTGLDKGTDSYSPIPA
jgi:signal transduction histidine kinase